MTSTLRPLSRSNGHPKSLFKVFITDEYNDKKKLGQHIQCYLRSVRRVVHGRANVPQNLMRKKNTLVILPGKFHYSLSLGFFIALKMI